MATKTDHTSNTTALLQARASRWYAQLLLSVCGLSDRTYAAERAELMPQTSELPAGYPDELLNWALCFVFTVENFDRFVRNVGVNHFQFDRSLTRERFFTNVGILQPVPLD